MKRSIATLILLFILLKYAITQPQNHKWIYNWSNVSNNDTFDWTGASVIDFNILPPGVYKDSDIHLDISEAYGSICSEFGEFLFYSNGQQINGSSHKAITNGDTINYGPRWEVFQFTDVDGNSSTNGFRGVQEIDFIPQPNTDTTFVFYHNNNEYFEIGDDFHYHLMIAKIINENGEPIVTSKDEVINDDIRILGTITACRHGNGRDWWLLQFAEDQVYTYLITPEGVHLDHMQVLPFELKHPSIGQSKFSPSGDCFSLHGVSQFGEPDGKGLLISRFDRCTGDLIDPKLDILSSFENLADNGLEFSPNGKLLYLSTASQIIQYDLEEDDVFSSAQVVVDHNGFNNCEFDIGTLPKPFGQMQLAPDNQIYISLASQCNDVHIIRHPNVRGPGCDVEQNAIILPTFAIGTIPNTNTYRLGPIDGSSCDTLGLDNNPVSRFWYEQDSMDFLSVQFWDVSYFRPEQWQWSFGDGQTSIERHPLHSYDEMGVYEVCLTVSNENSSDTSCDTLYIGVSGTEDFVDKVSLSVYPNPTEGMTRFLLSGYLPRQGVLLLYDLKGQLVLQEEMRTGVTVVDLSGLDIGTYVYELRDSEKVVGSGKIVRI